MMNTSAFNNISQKCGSVRKWYAHRIATSQLQPISLNIFSVFFVVVLTITAVTANVHVRVQQQQTWWDTGNIATVFDTLSFSTADAPFFLGHAKFHKSNQPSHAYERKRSYSNFSASQPLGNLDGDTVETPLLSVLISSIASSPENNELLKAAHQILPYLIALTAFMVVLGLGATGYWFEATVAALGGCLSSSFLIRTSVGRIDTDLLNLGFIYALFGALVLAANQTKFLPSIAFSIVAGILAQLFLNWYGKPELVLIALGSFAWLLLVNKRGVLLSTSNFLIIYAIAPFQVPNPFKSAYLKETIESGNFILPNTLSTISEVKPISFTETLIYLTGSLEMGLVCLFGLVIWMLRHPKLGIAYLPLIAFALLNYIIGNRAIFYSAPMLWFGGAIAFSWVSGVILNASVIADREIRVKRAREISRGCATILGLVIAWVNSPVDYVPRPSFPKPVLEGLIAINEQSIAEKNNSVTATWWDYGFASLFLNDIPVIHDGGSQTGPTTHLFAQALFSDNLDDTKHIIRYLANDGANTFFDFKSKEELFEHIQSTSESTDIEIFLVLTAQMQDWLGSIHKLANWDIETGKPYQISNKSVGLANVAFRPIWCRYNNFPDSINCNNISVNLSTGQANGGPLISGWSWTKDGVVKEVRNFVNHEGPFLQTMDNNNRRMTVRLERRLYESSFNKLFHHGGFEDPDFDLFYDHYPQVRIFKVRAATSNSQNLVNGQ